MKLKQKLFGNKKKTIISIICILIVVALVVNFVILPKTKKKEKGPSVSFIRTTTLKKSTLSETITANGLVATDKSSSVAAATGATVEEILVSVGDHVEKDQVVCILETDDGIDRYQENYDDAAKDYKDYIYVLNEVGKKVTNYSASGYDAASNTYTSYLMYDSPAEYLDRLESIYEASPTTNGRRASAYNQYVEAKKEYERVRDAKADALEALEDCMDDYELKAKTDGYVTAVSVKVGDVINSSNNTVVSIQDTDNLVVSISVYEYDVDKVYVGMPAIITSDSVEGEIAGEVSEVSPVASGGRTSSATFTTKVKVLDGSQGLHIGVNAKVKLIVNQTDDCWNVPIDAVETKENGDKIVYRKTGGSGVDMTFEEVKVTTGNQTDYYIEIDSDDLKDGDVIRASANLEEATFTMAEQEETRNMFESMGGTGMSMGQATNSGKSNNYGGGYGGGMPSGGMPSGGMMPGGF